MVNCNWTLTICSITKFKLNCLYVMLSVVIFMHIERIHKNYQFWTNCIETAKSIFRTCLLPELMGSWFTRPLAVDSSEGHNAQATEHSIDTAVHRQSDSQLDSLPSHDLGNESQPLPTCCYCRGPEFGRMLACDNKDCVIEWFHIECLKLRKSEHDSQREMILS